MYDHILEEMADAISQELHVSVAPVLSILSRYWQDKIADVWQVDDMLECACNNGQPITRADAAELLHRVFEKHDADIGINWTCLEVILEDYRFEFKKLPVDQWREVYGVFSVWREGEAATRQFGAFPDEVRGNLATALEFAGRLARESRDVRVFVGCKSQFDADEIQPWLAVLLKDGEAEPSITENDEIHTPSSLAISSEE